MMRRTPLFQELHFMMVNSPNPHNYGKEWRYKYRFGIFKQVSTMPQHAISTALKK